MKAPKLTPWFPGHIKPVRPGVYQQYSGTRRDIGYQRWDGRYWFGWCSSIEYAAIAATPVMARHQNDPWRGLAEQPK